MDKNFPTDFGLQNEEYSRLTPAQKLQFLEREMMARNGWASGSQIPAATAVSALGTAPPPVQNPNAQPVAIPPEVDSALVQQPGNFVTPPAPAAPPLRRPDMGTSGAVYGGVGGKLDQPASPEWWGNAGDRLQPGITQIGQGDKIRGLDSVVAGARSIDPDFAPPGPHERAGSDQAYRAAFGVVPPEQVASQFGADPGPATGPGKDPFAMFIDGLQRMNAEDSGAGIRAGVVLGSGVDALPNSQGMELERRRNKLDEGIAALAMQSQLPEPVFKERLAHIIVGAALGYARGYGQSGDVGQGLISAGAAGGAGGLQYDEMVEGRRDRAKQENLRRTTAALGAETQLYGMDSANMRQDQALDVARERTRVGQINSIRAAEAKLAAARITSGNANRWIKDGLDLIKLRKEFGLMNNPMLDTEIITQTGEKIKIGDIKDPQTQQAYLSAFETATVNAPLFRQKYAEAQKIIEEQRGGAWELLAKKAKPEELAQIITRDLLVQHYLSLAAGGQPPQ